ncbi:MFS transporter [Candidatus Cryosericum odellii]|uniref:MFS transporter n=1 Tax=Candidatus Cryosericum odellii TaxID=2290917 RepID=A0A398D3F5_9BACT|nr:MFS transporter [Candidatus Cryosericum odellii]RIE07405.1 MFS transporter [Candidatus Cryosericum odellii]RIE09030.1 MFS transporter [Candidatus Cryosericum odellii]
MNIRKRLPAFESKDYRLWFAGQSVSLVGTWLQNTGQSWLVLKLTNSPLKLGVLTSIQFLPSLILSVFIGPIIDRFPKRSILLFTQIMYALAAAALAVVTFGGHAQYWQVLVIAAVTGIISAIDWPTRQAFVGEQVNDRSAVVNAVALNSTMFNIARVIGPGIGGVLIAIVGIPWTFTLNAVSFIAVIVSLLLMKAGRKPTKSSTGSYAQEIREGTRYIAGNQIIISLLIISGVISPLLLNFNIMIPSFSMLTLHLQADGYGGLMSAMGVGAMAAGVLMSLGGTRLEPTPAYIYGSGFVLAVAMVLVGIQRNFYLTGLLLVFCGFGMAALSTMCNTALQMQSPDRMRGRVMAAYNLVWVGSTPIGALYAGKICDALGANMGFFVSGVIGVVFLGAMLVFVTPRVFRGLRTFAVADSSAGGGSQTVGPLDGLDARAPGVDKD